MSTLAASAAAPPSGLLIDPTKQAEYPILLGDKLAEKDGSKDTRFVNITYNHKSKSATQHQRSLITRSSSSPDIYNLTITDKAGNAEQTALTYSYKGSVDPASPVSETDTRNLVLVFDPVRKAFILEPVSSRLNFNLRSAPGKTDKQVSEQYPQLPTLHVDEHPSADERPREDASEDEDPGAADESNPYDFRHFLPKANADAEKNAISSSTTPDPHNVATKVSTPSLPAAKPPAPSIRKSKPQTNPLRQQKRAPKPAQTSKATEDKPRPEPVSKAKPDDNLAFDSAPSDEDQSQPASTKPAASPNSNIIIDGDLIIDMGSPPPSRKPFIVNPAHFSSNSTSANETDDDGDDEEDIEDLRLPSPAGPPANAQSEQANEEVEDDDALAAEMEAAFEESAREEEARRQQQQYAVASEDESEVSEEE